MCPNVRIKLSLFSLRVLFSHWSSPDSHVYNISNVSADVMGTIIEFAYTGLVTVTKENIQELFVAADRYDVHGITRACCKLMEDELSSQNCINTWWFTHMFYYPELQHKAFCFILRHFEEVVCSEDFLQLSVADLSKIIGQDQLNVREESTVFEAILRWIAHSPQDREKHMSQLLLEVRLAFMNLQYFSEHVIGNEMVMRNHSCKANLILAMKLMLEGRTRELNMSLFPIHLACPRLPQAVLMAIGGWSGENPTNGIELYDNRANRWVSVANNDETPRAYHGSVFLNGSVYCIGGFDGLEQFCTTHKYDLVNHTWQEVANMHTSRCYVSVTLLDGFIYAMGGYDGAERLETAERYAPDTNQWTMIAPMTEQRSDASSTALNGKIYICGGFNGSQCLSTAECYDPLTDQWTVIADMRFSRSGVSVIAYAGEVYAVGGFTGNIRLNTVEAYNPDTNTWHDVPSMMSPRSNFGIEVLDDRLFVIGGFNGFTTINCVESFDVKTEVWSDVHDMEISRSALSCCVVHDLCNMADYAAPHSAPPESNVEDTLMEE